MNYTNIAYFERDELVETLLTDASYQAAMVATRGQDTSICLLHYNADGSVEMVNMPVEVLS